VERKKRTNKNKTTTRKSRTQGRLGPYLSMRARRLQIYARRQIFQNHSLRPSPSLPLKPFWRSRKEDDSLSRKSHDNNASRKVPQGNDREKERTREREREKEKMRGHIEQTKREPKYIRKFKSSIRNNGPRAMTCTRRYGGG